jgi:hypothetical protein
MPSGGAMSVAWMRMPGQKWACAAVSFLGMWVAMRPPCLLPVLLRYREHRNRMGEVRRGRLSAGYVRATGNDH